MEQSQEYLSIQDMVTRFEAAHPNIHIDIQYVNSDNALQKATVALQGGKQPDISYQYGTNMPQLATAPKLVDLTQRVQDPSFDWNDFFEGERAVATVDGRVLAIPALVDNLAIVYNKDLFAKAGVPTPTPDWTWDDVRAAAKATTDPANKVFGLVFPADASETMVWQFEAMLWEAGGDILNADNTQAAFNSPAGRPRRDDAPADAAGRIALPRLPPGLRPVHATSSTPARSACLITGPWDLSAFPDVNYGVQQMPSFDPGGSHITIAGPDNWVIFDNGPDRVEASVGVPAVHGVARERPQGLDLATSHLRSRASVEQMPGFSALDTKFPGVGAFAPEPGQRHEGAAADHAVPAGLQLPRARAREHPAGPGVAAGCAEPGGATRRTAPSRYST